ncbi:MAG: DUF1499 domain-containing protein [Leptolyngbyaceae cyanobacterium]
MVRLNSFLFGTIRLHLASFILFAGLMLLSWLEPMPVGQAQPLSDMPLVASLFHFSGTRPDTLGVEDGQLQPCPSTPNCVSSQSKDNGHGIAPFTFRSSASEAFEQLKSVIQFLPRAEIITANSHYLYAEFTTEFMGFVDDVECYLDEAANEIQVRSASRLGESDLGVNRKRVEQIRTLLKEKQATLVFQSAIENKQSN